jgi:hypothetical protein
VQPWCSADVLISRSQKDVCQHQTIPSQVSGKARATKGFMRQSRIARNAYVRQQTLAAYAVARMQQRLDVQPGERLKW